MTPDEQYAIWEREKRDEEKKKKQQLVNGHSVTLGAFVPDNQESEWEQPAPFNEYTLPSFPLASLPLWMRAYVEGLAVSTQTPVDMAAMLALANVSAAIAGNVVLHVRDDWKEPTNIYNVNVLSVGNRKTAVHDAVKEPLEEKEFELIREMQPTIDEKRLEKSILEERLDHLKKQAGKSPDPLKQKEYEEEAKAVAALIREVIVPAVPKLIISGDATPEAIAGLLADQGGRLFLSSDEGELFEMLAGRYGNGSPNFEIILKAHTGSKARVDRRGRSEVIDSATLSIGLTVQPEVLRGLADRPGFRGKGLLGRWLYCMPTSLVGRRSSTPHPLNEPTKREYKQRIKTLAGLGKIYNEKGELVPRTVRMERDAVIFLTIFMDAIEPQMAEGGDLHSIADWASKLAGAIARIAALLHYADYSLKPNDICDIPEDTIKRAVQIGLYLIPHAQACYAEMGADPQIENAKHLLRWIVRESKLEFSKREAHRGCRKFKKITELEPALELLAAQGYIRMVTRYVDPGKTGRRPGQLFESNPILFDADK